MSEIHDPHRPLPPNPPAVSSARAPAAPTRPPGRGGSTFFGIIFGMSLTLNLIFVGIVVLGFFGLFMLGSLLHGSDEEKKLTVKHHSGDASADDKIAIINVSGVIMDGMMSYVNKQIEQAAADKHVKAVVLRINSPGGSITASDDLHRRLCELRDGKDGHGPKPIVVSMGAMAASGGYYIAMPGKTIYAERSTMTGSIGVFIPLLNVKELGDKYGVKMEIIKAGAIKDSGSMFHELTPEERFVWQQMVNHAYGQFKDVVEEGRPSLKGKLEDKVIDRQAAVMVKEKVKVGDAYEEKEVEKKIQYVRQRADGGIWTADEAKTYGLIDHIGYLDDAIKEAAKAGGLGSKYNVISYERQLTLADVLLGVKSPAPAMQVDPSQLADGATPRLWYLAPQSELAGMLSTVRR
jgi:protease-4